MTRRLTALMFVTAGFLALVLAQAPPDFSGKWKLDPGQSSAVGGGTGAGTGRGNSMGGGLGLGASPEELTITRMRQR